MLLFCMCSQEDVCLWKGCGFQAVLVNIYEFIGENDSAFGVFLSNKSYIIYNNSSLTYSSITIFLQR